MAKCRRGGGAVSGLAILALLAVGCGPPAYEVQREKERNAPPGNVRWFCVSVDNGPEHRIRGVLTQNYTTWGQSGSCVKVFNHERRWAEDRVATACGLNVMAYPCESQSPPEPVS